jgi:transposase
MDKQITIRTLAKQKLFHTHIAAEVNCHRNTVANILKRTTPVDVQTRNKSSGYGAYHDQLKEWLDKKVSRVRMHELLHEQYGLTFRYDTMCKYIQQHFPKVSEAFGVQETTPGDVAEVDFGYGGLLPINAPGEPLKTAKTWFLSVRLTHSRLAHREMVHDQKVTTFIAGITHAFESFGGVPKRLRIDNLRAAVLKNQRYDLELNPDFLGFSEHYAVVINPCVPYHPEQKGGVESDVKYIEGNFLVERMFTDWVDVKRQFQAWSTGYANTRVHGITKRVPAEVFASEEKLALQMLPTTTYALFDRCERHVQKNCHVFFQNNYYSVPSKLVGKHVTLRFNQSLLKVTYYGEEVACHLLSSGVGKYVTSRSHLPEFKCYSETEFRQKHEAKMADIGEHALAYFREVLLKDKYWFRSVRIILGLAKDYGNEATDLSLARALNYHVTDVHIIKRIVEQKLYQLDKSPKLLTTKSAAGTSLSPAALVPPLAPVATASPTDKFVQVVRDHLLPTVTGSPPPVFESAATNPASSNAVVGFDRDLKYYQELLPVV